VRRFLFAPIKAKQAQKENVPQAKPVLRRSAPPLLYGKYIVRIS